MKVPIYGVNVDISPKMDNPLYWTVGAIFGSGIVIKVLKWVYVKYSLASKRRVKRQDRQEALQKLKNIVAEHPLPAQERQMILSYNFETLRSKLKSGELLPKDVLVAYQEKAIEVHEKTNCLVEPIFEAIELAEELPTRGNKGALYGIPVSIKDNYGIKGYDCTIGCSNWIDRPWEEDSSVVQILKEEGAIPFVKTNVPQTMISYETTNPIYGETRNPQDLTRGVGGSSGGEGALISAGGSILGFGSDIGGSIRIPASMNGICGIKPTSARVYNKGTHPIYKGQTNLTTCYGPLANDVGSLIAAMEVLCSERGFNMEPITPPIPFDKAIIERREKLRIGFFTDVSYFKAVPAMERGVMEAKKKLEALGHEVVPWDFPVDSRDLAKQWGLSLFADGGYHLNQLLKCDSYDSAILSLNAILILPQFMKTILSYLLAPIEPNAAMLLDVSRGYTTINQWWDLSKCTSDTRAQVIKSWKESKLDAVICPAFACPPLPFGASAYASGATIYTMVFNMIDFAAGSLPITKVTKDDVRQVDSYPTKDLWHRTVKKGQVGTEGLKVNVQVVTLPWKEELCLRVMKELEEEVQMQ